MIISYIKLALQVLRSIFFTKLAFLGVLLSVVIVFVFVWYVRRQTRNKHVLPWTLTAFERLNFEELIEEEDLIVIGNGGSGNVYRVILRRHGGGRLDNYFRRFGTGRRRTVAVKELRRSKKQEDKNKNLDKQFDAEVKALSSIRHGNIVTLLCCITSICTRLLVYEDMQNGSLDQWLHKHRYTKALR